jgi:hypothetical protein
MTAIRLMSGLITVAAAALIVQGCSGLWNARVPPTSASAEDTVHPRRANRGPELSARTAPTDVIIDDVNVFPESVTASNDGTLFTGSVKGIVYRALAGELRAVPWIRSSRENGILAILGVLADTRSGTLWLCSVPSPLRGAPPGATSSLMAFDLSTGVQKGVYPFPPPASACNDITVADDGSAYASDTPNGRIFRLAPGARELTLYLEDARLKGIDGLAFSADGTLYVNIVTTGALLRIERDHRGAPAGITQLALSRPLGGPDGFRLIEGSRFLLAEGTGGRVDEVVIRDDTATVEVLREGLNSPPGVTRFSNTAYVVEGKIGFLIDPKLKGQDPGTFTIRAIALDSSGPSRH